MPIATAQLRRALFSILGPVLILSLGSCGDDLQTCDCENPPQPLRFTRQDGSPVAMPAGADTFVWCGDWRTDVPVPAIRVRAGTFVHGETYWELRAVVADVEIGRPLYFPNYFVWDQPDSVNLFLSDPAGDNELSTQEEEGSGSIVFHRLPCGGDSVVSFTIDAVLGSELHLLPTVRVQGEFTAPATDPFVPDATGRRAR